MSAQSQSSPSNGSCKRITVVRVSKWLWLWVGGGNGRVDGVEGSPLQRRGWPSAACVIMARVVGVVASCGGAVFSQVVDACVCVGRAGPRRWVVLAGG